MAKKIKGFIKLQIPAGKANPAPPVGPALGQHGVNIMEFCKAFNAKTQEQMGKIIPVEITVFVDRSFTFITKTPPAASLILEAAGIPKGSGEPNKEKVGAVSSSQIKKIAEKHGFGFIDVGPDVRSASKYQIIHGVVDQNHFNKTGYEALSTDIAEIFLKPGGGVRTDNCVY